MCVCVFLCRYIDYLYTDIRKYIDIIRYSYTHAYHMYTYINLLQAEDTSAGLVANIHVNKDILVFWLRKIKKKYIDTLTLPTIRKPETK